MGDTHLGNEAETRGQRPEPGGEFEADEAIGAIWDEHEVRMAVESLRHGRTGPEVGGESDGDEYAHEEFLSVVVGAMARTSASTAAALSNTGAVDRVKPKRVADPKAECGPSLLGRPFTAGRNRRHRAARSVQARSVTQSAQRTRLGAPPKLGTSTNIAQHNGWSSPSARIVTCARGQLEHKSIPPGSPRCHSAQQVPSTAVYRRQHRHD